MDKPLISCIMPTANRRAFVPRAIGYFLRQEYPNKELLILDDGIESVADLIPADPQIRYLRLTGKRTLGRKRNECVEAARGDLIMHWDDDDWHGPDRIARQVRALLQADAEVCSVTRMLFYEVDTGVVWLYHYPEGKRRTWLAGGTLLYTRDFWRRAPFPDIQIGEDTRFIFNQRLERAVVLPDLDLYVATIHPGNTSPKSRRGAYWTRWQGDLRLVLGPDFAAYTAGAPPSPPRMQSVATQSKEHQPMDVDQRVTVAIPYYRAKGYLRKAVESILTQTHRDLQLIVVNDGDPDPPWPELAAIRDPRLVRFDLPLNRGRYFADAVVLNAIDTPYYVVQDADDWSEPNRIAALLHRLRECHADLVVSGFGYVDLHGRKTVKSLPATMFPLRPQLSHLIGHQGLFRVAALRAIGGYYAGFRLGYDTLLMNLLLMTARVAECNAPLYVRRYRPDSLVNSTATGLRSHTRLESTRELRAIYETAFVFYREFLEGRRSHTSLIESIRTLIEGHISPDDRSALDCETSRLRELLAQPPSEPAAPLIRSDPAPSAAPESGRPNLKHMLDSPALNWGGWAISRIVAAELFQRLCHLKPRTILEAGSGVSSVFLAHYAAEHGACLTILEHDAAYYAATRRQLAACGLLQFADVRLIPLVEQLEYAGRFWYHTDLHGPFDFVFIDGPPEKFGRTAALFALEPHLAPHWELWLHNGNRAHECASVALWRTHFSFSASQHDLDEKGVWILSNTAAPSPSVSVPAESIAISMLTGQRLDLFKQTVQSLQSRAGRLLDSSYVLLMINGDDPATAEYAATLPFVDQIIRHKGAVLPIGAANTRLAQALANKAEFLLHLEDDWCISSLDSGWLAEAVAILTSRPEIGQVRLRHIGETVLPYHMLTRRPIQWRQQDGYLYAEQAHFTFNPSLIRAQDALKIYPCAHEREAQQHYLASGLASAQLVPGVFRHTGERNSLRRTLQRA